MDTRIGGLLRKEEKLKKVNLSKARTFDGSDESISADNFYNNSGLSAIKETIIEQIGEVKIESLFFEYSTLCSTLDSNTLSAFLCLWQKKSVLPQDSLADKLEEIIAKLFKAKLSLYYLPEFFIAPEEASANITVLPSFKDTEVFKQDVEHEFNVYLDRYNEVTNQKSNSLKKPLKSVADKHTSVQNLSLSGVSYDYMVKKSREFKNQKVLPNHLLLHHLYDQELLSDEVKDSKCTTLISIPLLGAPMGDFNEGYNGQGALFIYLVTKNEIGSKILKSLIPELSILNKDITYNYLFEVGYTYAERAYKSALRAAISQIMNRQMSHNINSHVMANLVNLSSFNDEDIRSFLRYLQSRIEFIADIVTSEPLVTFSANLVSDVLDGFFGKIENKGNWPLYIIKYISGSNEVTYGTWENQQNISIEHELRNRDIQIALPNNILGAQAFYVILENIIRNSVKHATIPEKVSNGEKYKDLKITICTDNNFNHPDYYKVVIKDNLGSANQEQREKKTYGENKDLRIDTWLNSKLDKKVLDENGKLRQKDWGLLEMKICAAYLRKYPLDQIDQNHSDNYLTENPEKKLIDITLDDDNNLCYEFYLLKPKLACVIFEKDIPSDLFTEQERLQSLGITTIELQQIADIDALFIYGELKLNDGKRHEVSHPYLLLEKGIINGRKVRSNQSYLELEAEKLTSLLKYDDIEQEILRLLLDALNNEVKEVKFLDADKDGEKNFPDCANSGLANSIIFHLHLERLLNNSELHLSDYPKNCFYYEPYSSQSPTAKIKQLIADQDNSSIKHELNLAASLRVGILDERIQADASKDDNHDQIILDGMNVHIPNSQNIDLNANSFHVLRNEILLADKIKDWIEDKKVHMDYILIHMGIIEKIQQSTEPEDIQSFLENYSSDGDKGQAELIVISGRGKPSNLPDRIFYLPFSLVNQYVITYRSKLYIYKLLKAARRYNG
ncbi:MAG: hypothetical protein WD048_15920 [Chitinophagales bacterium]